DTSNPVVVSYYSAGTATPQVDFTGLPDYNSVTNEGQVTIPAGQSWVEFAINPVADGVTEGTETAKIALLPPPGYAVRNPNFAIVNVLDDSRPTVTIQATDDYAFEEGSPTDPATFRVTRAGMTSTALTVSYTIGGTATNGSDYVALSGTIT